MTARTAWLRDRLQHRINGAVQQRARSDGVDVPAREWDTLVVLDACRADLFRDTIHPIHDRFTREETEMSRASSTDEWLRRTWPDTYGDTVYVAGNPLVSRHAPARWHHLVEAWRDGWSDEHETITAAAVTQAGVQAHRDYPEKCVVVHYLQPHAPLITRGRDRFSGWQTLRDVDRGGRAGYKNIWLAAGDGQVSMPQAWQRYRETLQYALDEVNRLLDSVDGRVVVTSDHGNYLGERGWPLPIRQYGHPPGHRQRVVRDVPWCIRDDERREIVPGDVSTSAGNGPDEEQLEALGYV